MRRLIILLLMGTITLAGIAQEKVYQKNELDVTTNAEGQLQFSVRDLSMSQFKSKEKILLNGLCRIIERWEDHGYTLAEFKDGRYHGSYQHFVNDKLKEECSYKEGKKEGINTTYYADGKLSSSITYKNNKANGTLIAYQDDGTLWQICNYVEDRIEGTFKEFYSTGNLRSEYTYKNDKPEGAYKLFFADGTLREEGCCKAGVEVYRKEYYPNGQLKMIQELKEDNWQILEQHEPTKQISNSVEQIILSQKDSLKVLKCQETVAQINDSLPQYDVSEYNFQDLDLEVTIDKSGHLRKYSLKRGEIEYIAATAYYNAAGKLVQVECSNGSNCEYEDATYYIDNGIVVDCKILFYCPCCEDEYNYPEERTTERLRMRGHPFEKHIQEWNLAELIKTEDVLLKLDSQQQ